MARMALPNGRLLELKWDGAKGVWIVRLLQGSVFLTPKLHMTVKECHTVFTHHSIQLGEWLTLCHNLAEFDVTFKKERSVKVKWSDFYNLAVAERPDPLACWNA